MDSRGTTDCHPGVAIDLSFVFRLAGERLLVKWDWESIRQMTTCSGSFFFNHETHEIHENSGDFAAILSCVSCLLWSPCHWSPDARARHRIPVTAASSRRSSSTRTPRFRTSLSSLPTNPSAQPPAIQCRSCLPGRTFERSSNRHATDVHSTSPLCLLFRPA